MAGRYANGAGNERRYEQRLTVYVLVACMTAASGGLVFGYEIGIMGGVSPTDDFLKRFFPLEYLHRVDTNNYCHYSNKIFQVFASCFYLAGIIAAWSASFITESQGRRPSIVVAGFSLVCGTLISAAAQNVTTLIVGRIILGIGLGFGYQSVPLYLSEMAPSNHRGGLNMMFQLATTIGVLCAHIVHYGAMKIHPWGWRFSTGLAVVPAMFLVVAGLFLPETPQSLIQRDKFIEGREILEKMRGSAMVVDGYHGLVEASRGAKAMRHPLISMMERQYRPYVVMAVFLPLSQAATGISAVLFFVPQLLAMIGFNKDDSSLYSAIIIGSILCLSNVVSIILVDRVGRKIFFYQGGLQMFICQAAIGMILKYNLGLYNILSGPVAGVLLILIHTYVAAFGWSWSSLVWTVPSEMFPLEIRSAGQSLVVSVNFFCTFWMNQALLTMICKFQHLALLFFAGWILVITSLVWFFLPETSNVSIEGVARVWRAHWFWKRYVVPNSEST